MSEINLEIEKVKGLFDSETLKVKFDKQIRDTYDDEDTSDFNYVVEAESLTELHNKLYDLTQTEDCIPNDAVFKLDGELFAKMIGGYHLSPNMQLSSEIVDKYAQETELHLSISDTLVKAYAENEKVDGLTVYKTDGIKAYNNVNEGNHIKDSKGNVVFKDRAEALMAVRDYLDNDSAYIASYDKVKVKVDGVDIGTLSYGTLTSPTIVEEEKMKNKRKTGRKPF